MTPGSEYLDVIVVGGGLIGAACAEACAAAELRVRLIEEERIGGGATRAGMGHVMQVPGELLALTRYSQKLWRARAADWIGQVPIRPTGTIWLARDEDREQTQLDRLEKALTHAKAEVERLDRDALHRQEPALGPTVTDGVWAKEDLLVDPAATTLRLVALGQARKMEVMEGMRVESLVEGGVRLAEGTTLRAEHVVLAAGVETVRLLPDIPLRPHKGHLVHLASPTGYVRSQLAEVAHVLPGGFDAEETVAFDAHPTPSGGLWVGTSRQVGEESSDVEEPMVRRIVDHAREFLPKVAEFPMVRRWTGLRAASADHLPFIGSWPGSPDLVVATGHEALGVTTSLATGRIVADLVTGRPSEIDRSLFALEGRGGPLPKRSRSEGPAKS